MGNAPVAVFPNTHRAGLAHATRLVDAQAMRGFIELEPLLEKRLKDVDWPQRSRGVSPRVRAFATRGRRPRLRCDRGPGEYLVKHAKTVSRPRVSNWLLAPRLARMWAYRIRSAPRTRDPGVIH